jgi:hypothetical protein
VELRAGHRKRGQRSRLRRRAGSRTRAAAEGGYEGDTGADRGPV